MKKALHLFSNINYACGISRLLKVIFSNQNSDFEHYGLFIGGEALEDFIQNFNGRIFKYKNESFLLQTYECASLAKNLQIDIIHAHTRRYDLIARIVKGFVSEVKTITSAHYFSNDRKLLSYKADRFIAVSEKIKKNLIKNYNISDQLIDVIYNPVDKSLYNPRINLLEEREKLKISSDFIIASYIGRFVYDVKFLDIITKNMQNIISKNNRVYFLFAGEGKDKQMLQKEIKPFDKNAKIINPGKNVESLYQISDIIIVPSPIETFGLTAIEAGLYSKAVLAHENGAPGEYLINNQNAVLFNENNYVEKFLALAENKSLRERIGANLKKYVDLNFNENIFFEKLKNSYDRLIEKNSLIKR